MDSVVLTRLQIISPAPAPLLFPFLFLSDAIPIMALETLLKVAMRKRRKGKAIAGGMRRAGNERLQRVLYFGCPLLKISCASR
jgi:hypothetical protein